MCWNESRLKIAEYERQSIYLDFQTSVFCQKWTESWLNKVIDSTASMLMETNKAKTLKENKGLKGSKGNVTEVTLRNSRPLV